MGPLIEDLSEEFNGKAKFGKINIDDNPELASRFNVSLIPNFVIFKDGKIMEQIIGSMTQEELGNVLREHIN